MILLPANIEEKEVKYGSDTPIKYTDFEGFALVLGNNPNVLYLRLYLKFSQPGLQELFLSLMHNRELVSIFFSHYIPIQIITFINYQNRLVFEPTILFTRCFPWCHRVPYDFGK